MCLLPGMRLRSMNGSIRWWDPEHHRMTKPRYRSSEALLGRPEGLPPMRALAPTEHIFKLEAQSTSPIFRQIFTIHPREVICNEWWDHVPHPASHLIAFTVVFKTSWSFAITPFAVTSIGFSLLSFPYLRLESFWVSVKACLSKQTKRQLKFNHTILKTAKGINFHCKTTEFYKNQVKLEIWVS